MSNLHSLVVIVLVMAAIFVPQFLALYFSESYKSSSDEEEYVSDGR